MKALLKLLTIGNIKIYLIVAILGATVWFYKDWKFQKAENIRQSENVRQLRLMDSLKYASQTYTKKELQEYLDYNRKDLSDFLKEQKINNRRIERIITQTLKYRDTSKNTVNLQPILDAIENNTNGKVPVIDSTACLIIKGYVLFEGDSLSLNITDREFKNKSDVISYWQRNQKNLFTRMFGKKETTIIIKDDCGNTETFIIETKKKK